MARALLEVFIAGLALETVLPIVAIYGRLSARIGLVHGWGAGRRIIGKRWGRDRSRKVGKFGGVYGGFGERKGVVDLVGEGGVVAKLLRKQVEKVVVGEIGELGRI